MPQELIHLDLGLMSYDAALDVQQRLLAVVQAQPERAFLLTVEHAPAVITLGRNAKAANVLAGPERLTELGVEVRHTSRGGDVTYHGPGQLVAYPIMRVDRRGGLRAYVFRLEQAIIDVLGTLGIQAGRADGLAGVWAGGAKIAAIGIGVSRWVAYHGLALNVSPDLSGFGLIVPCGLAGKGVTSVQKELGRAITIDEVRPLCVQALAKALGFASVRTGGKEELNRLGDMGAPVMIPTCVSPVVVSGKQGQDGPATHGQDAHATHGQDARATRTRLPAWLIKPIAPVRQAPRVRRILEGLKLATVCADARCPNRGECYARGTAAFMIMGHACTRSCRFCAVEHARPEPLNGAEPQALAQACVQMRLRHVVITSVTRDDLPDGGAAHFAAAIRAVRYALPQASIEVLTPDFQGRTESIRTVIEARPSVFNHNIETVPRLYWLVRPQADYARSLHVLSQARELGSQLAPGLLTKSGIMVGLGERPDEVVQAMRDLRQTLCDILTIGQYLSPSDRHLAVTEFIAPAQFDQWRSQALELGFSSVAAGPFVRSSYRADEVMQQAK